MSDDADLDVLNIEIVENNMSLSIISPWIDNIVNTYKKCEEELFGADSTINVKRIMDYTVLPNYKFVLAKYKDDLYRPASIIGRNKKLLIFIVYFYHNKKCSYVKPKNVIFLHGNLLDRKVCFRHEGHTKKGTVLGNNSPANCGIPSLFYIKRRKCSKWYKVNFKKIFLTKKQVNMYFKRPRRYFSGNICKKRSPSRNSHCRKSSTNIDY